MGSGGPGILKLQFIWTSADVANKLSVSVFGVPRRSIVLKRSYSISWHLSRRRIGFLCASGGLRSCYVRCLGSPGPNPSEFQQVRVARQLQ